MGGQLRTGDRKIKQVHKFKYLGIIIREDRKYDTETRKCFRRMEDDFQKKQNIKNLDNIVRKK